MQLIRFWHLIGIKVWGGGQEINKTCSSTLSLVCITLPKLELETPFPASREFSVSSSQQGSIVLD